MAEPDSQASTYGTEAMNTQQQQMDYRTENGRDIVVAGGDSIDNSQIRYESQSLHDGGGGGVLNGVDEVHAYDLYVPRSEIPLATVGGNQLTLSFQGEVYVFEAVSPEKVQAVLLLLGGYEVPTGTPTVGVAPQNHRGLSDFSIRLSQPQRVASLNRFRKKRKALSFEKKTRYSVRKEVALRMQRRKGQFISSKALAILDEVGSSDWNASQGPGQEEQETLCTHCGISSKSTPMMRRGPDGPKTLCNACGLKWANKGTLKDHLKVSAVGTQDPAVKAEQSEGEAKDSDAVCSAADILNSFTGDYSAVTADALCSAADVLNSLTAVD